MWAISICHNPRRTRPWEIWEKLPDGRTRYVCAFQTWRQAVAEASSDREP